MYRFLSVSVFLLAFAAMATAQELKFKFPGKQKINFEQTPAGMTKAEAKVAAATIYEFFRCIDQNDYEGWRKTLSAETFVRVAPHKFPRKFKRLQEYGLQDWKSKTIVSMQSFTEDSFKEKGTMYIVIFQLPEGKKLANRVGFDPLKDMERENKESFMGLHLVKHDDGTFQVFLAKSAAKSGAAGENKEKKN